VKAPRQFPVVVRTGSVGVKIYRADREKDGSEYTSYTLSCTAADGRRKLKAIPIRHKYIRDSPVVAVAVAVAVAAVAVYVAVAVTGEVSGKGSTF